MATQSKWVQKAIEHEGALRKELGVKEGRNILLDRLEEAAKAGGKLGKRARLALTLRKMHKKKN